MAETGDISGDTGGDIKEVSQLLAAQVSLSGLPDSIVAAAGSV